MRGIMSREYSISKKIKEFRLKAGMSQNKLARETGFSVNSIANIERGITKEPSIYTIIKIADVIGVSLDELVGREFKNGRTKIAR